MSGSTTRGIQTVAWFNCYSGIAGDMALGSLLDAGADLDELMRLLDRLPIGGWSLAVEPVLRAGLAATRAKVEVRGTTVVRTFSHIRAVLEEARLPERVRDRALATFTALAAVEGQLHRRPPEHVHFHEVGGHDAIVDIVGTAAALELLEVDVVGSGPVSVGTGVVRTSHGLLPNPAPAVVALLEGIPVRGQDLNVELTTPTGAALVASLASELGPLPAMVPATTGFGAGERELEGIPNCTQVVIGSRAGSASDPSAEPPGQQVVLLETNVDDATGETLAHAVEALLEAGAADAWLSPLVMKKGRPGHLVSVLCDPALAGAIGELLLRETGSLGVRFHDVERWPASRFMSEVDVDGSPLRVKVSPGRVKVEHADAARLARRTGTPLREIVVRAEAAWRAGDERGGGGGPAGSDSDGPETTTDRSV